MESIYSKFYGNTQQQPFKIGAWNTAPRLRHSSSMPSIYNTSTAKPLPQLVNRTYNQPHINNNNHNVDAMKLQMLEYKLNNLENKSNELNRMNQQLTQMNYQPAQSTGYYPPAPLTGQMPGTSNYLMRQPTPIPTILRPPPQQMQMPMPPPQMQMPMPHQQMQVPPHHQQMLVPPHQMIVPPPYYYYPPPVYDNIPYDNYDRRVSSHGRNNRYTKPKKQKQRKYKLKSNNSNKENSIETDRPEMQNPNENNNNNNNEYNDISESEHTYDDEEDEETYRKPKQKQKQNNPNKKLISKSLKILNPKQGKYFMNDIRNNLALKLQQDQFENSNNINIIQQSCNEIRSILSDKLDKIETKQRLDFENLKNALYHGGSNKLKASMLNEFNGRHYDVNNYPDFTIPEEIKNIPQLIDKKIHDFEYKKEYEKNRQERLEKEIREKVANEIKIQKYLSSIKNNSISYLPPISYEGPSNVYGYNDEELLQAKIDIKVEEALKERDLERIKRLENEINKKELEIKTDYLKNLKLQQEIDQKNKMNSYIKDVPFVYEYNNNNSSKVKDDNNEGNKKKKEKIKHNEDDNNKARVDNKDNEVKNEEHGKENKTKKKKRKKKNKDNDSVHKDKNNDNMIKDIKEPSIKTNNDDVNKDIREPIKTNHDEPNKDIKEPINNNDVNKDIPEPNVNNDSDNENVNNDVPEPEGIKIKTPEAEDNGNNNSEGANQYVATFE